MKKMPKKVDSKLEPKTKPQRHWLNGLTKWLWLAVIVLVVFEALITNNQAASGGQLASLQTEQSSLSIEVDQLQRQVTAEGSLQLIQQRASQQLGMQPVDKNVLYLQLMTQTGTTP